jgi:hypothetical protein
MGATMNVWPSKVVIAGDRTGSYIVYFDRKSNAAGEEVDRS